MQHQGKVPRTSSLAQALELGVLLLLRPMLLLLRGAGTGTLLLPLLLSLVLPAGTVLLVIALVAAGVVLRA